MTRNQGRAGATLNESDWKLLEIGIGCLVASLMLVSIVASLCLTPCFRHAQPVEPTYWVTEVLGDPSQYTPIGRIFAVGRAIDRISGSANWSSAHVR